MEQPSSGLHMEDIYDDAADSNQGIKKESPTILIHEVDEVIYDDSDKQQSYDYPTRPPATDDKGNGEYNYIANSTTTKMPKDERIVHGSKPHKPVEALSSVYSYAGEDLVAASLQTSQSPEPAIYSSLRSDDIPQNTNDHITEGGGTTFDKYATITTYEDTEVYSQLNH